MPVGVRILDADGKVVAEQKNDIHFNAKWRDREYELPSISLENAKLWSPDSPYLYTAEVTLYDSEGNIADQIKEPFGVRTIEIVPQKGLLVNGKKVLLKGYANHHTLGALGAAAYPRAIEKRLVFICARSSMFWVIAPQRVPYGRFTQVYPNTNSP